MTQQAGYFELLYFEAGGAEADASSRNLLGSPLKRSSPFQGPLSERRRHAAHKTCIADNRNNRGQKQSVKMGAVASVILPLCSCRALLSRSEVRTSMTRRLIGRRPQIIKIAHLVKVSLICYLSAHEGGE
jgi:hypothetical protein